MNYFLKILIFVVPSTAIFAMDAPNGSFNYMYLSLKVKDELSRKNIKFLVSGRPRPLQCINGHAEIPLKKQMDGKYYRAYITLLMRNAAILRATITYSERWNYASIYLSDSIEVIDEERIHLLNARPERVKMLLQVKKDIPKSQVHIKCT